MKGYTKFKVGDIVSGIYLVTPGALEINKIDLVKHEKISITQKEAGAKLRDFLGALTKPHGKLIPVGHNVSFDIDQITGPNGIITKKDWELYTSYRTLDIAVVGRFLVISGLLPEASNLESYAKLFKLDTTNLHTTKQDTLLTINILKEMFKRVVLKNEK